MIRQGDVMLVPVERGGVKAKDAREAGRIVLAHGEVSGHAHVVESIDADFYETVEGERFLSAPQGGTLVHDEHATLTIPAGTYRVVRQREYSPLEIRNVAD
ncbi:MAG: hypothetical protein A2Y38_24060 [Spirochaetes bacterium GWB1_59_5]|nr:MAG: hypothetical protein A2Y38_24060 [Spirochaetes bacterium GWB1_59_5]